MSLLREFSLGWFATFIRPFMQRSISVPQEVCDTVENASSPNADFCRTTTRSEGVWAYHPSPSARCLIPLWVVPLHPTRTSKSEALRNAYAWYNRSVRLQQTWRRAWGGSPLHCDDTSSLGLHEYDHPCRTLPCGKDSSHLGRDYQCGRLPRDITQQLNHIFPCMNMKCIILVRNKTSNTNIPNYI